MTCKQDLGAKRFDATQLSNYKYHDQPKLQCKGCVDTETAKVKALRQKLQDHKKDKQKRAWVCNCWRPFHSERCPLSPTFQGERRWPGGRDPERLDTDGPNIITKEERRFLDSLKPEPEWWSRAWGRRKQK